MVEQIERWAEKQHVKFEQSRDRVLELIRTMDVDDLKALQYILDVSIDTVYMAASERLIHERLEIFDGDQDISRV